MTACPDRDPMLQALLDGELDAANALPVEAHLATCQGCAAHYAALQTLRDRLATPGIAPAAPARLRDNIEAMIAAESKPRAKARESLVRRRGWSGLTAGWASAGAMAAVAASLLVVQIQAGAPSLESQLIADHVRSTLAAHLIDVATSDRHVVKPWFNGKIDFAPPVIDLADQGFPLVGGRLDYADNQVVAAVVYKRRAHTINLFILPSRAQPWGLAWPGAGTRTSYSVIRWTQGGLDFWAVSDLEAGELDQFHKDFAARAPS
jgi:anti-sigma factor RsiW